MQRTTRWSRICFSLLSVAADLHPHLDHVPADTGETALEAAHVTVLDDAAAPDRSQGGDRTRTPDPRSGTDPAGDPPDPRPGRTVRHDRSEGRADA